jgi:hypothetical protein
MARTTKPSYSQPILLGISEIMMTIRSAFLPTILAMERFNNLSIMNGSTNG